jgi:uncharacterized Zn finger protein
MNTLRKKGKQIEPIEITGRKIARTFWGQAWCQHLEKFSDYANRLPRGRTYVRNGSVCHLEVAEGVVKAMVSGSDLYQVTVGMRKLPKKTWRDITRRCSGQIGSLLELLQGKLSASVMKIVTDGKDGLFPKPGEMSLSCSCPDWATMCKHVAAVLYGVGARLDDQPEMLFLLRGVNHEELVSDSLAGKAAQLGAGTGRRRGRRLADEKISDVFGIEMEATGEDAGDRGAKPRSVAKPKAKAKAAAKPRARGPRGSRVATPAGKDVRALRRKFAMTQGEFAALLGVSVGSIVNWESSRGRLRLQAHSFAAWQRAARLTRIGARRKYNRLSR